MQNNNTVYSYKPLIKIITIKKMMMMLIDNSVQMNEMMRWDDIITIMLVAFKLS